MTSHATRPPRRTVTLPPGKVTAFRAKCRERGHIGSTLIVAWLWGAEGRVDAGLPLPPAGSQPPRGAGERGSMLWSQTEHEYQRCVAKFAAAGSSVRDVIGELVDLYIECDGDLPSITDRVRGKSGGQSSVEPGDGRDATGQAAREDGVQGPESVLLPAAS